MKPLVPVKHLFDLTEGFHLLHPSPAVTQHEQQRPGVPSGVSVRGGPPSRCYRGHALPEVLARRPDHVHPCVSGHHHAQVSGIRLH